MFVESTGIFCCWCCLKWFVDSSLRMCISLQKTPQLIFVFSLDVQSFVPHRWTWISASIFRVTFFFVATSEGNTTTCFIFSWGEWILFFVTCSNFRINSRRNNVEIQKRIEKEWSVQMEKKTFWPGGLVVGCFARNFWLCWYFKNCSQIWFNINFFSTDFTFFIDWETQRQIVGESKRR